MTESQRDIVLDVHAVGKRYRLGSAGSGTLSEDLGAWMARLRGQPDPRLTAGAEDPQRQGADFWALRDVSFSVERGEMLGIIGRNGAGKSTLLKLLSRITLPTTGEIRMRGRMSSLLEVGTGFNPELTGRENIFLNGAILGMRKAEIQRKLEEIIAFSGIQHHIDTPVKRYSSGMKVRLGFSVAAHLEPEILVIDEVLAVGDADFQRKCMGKMKDVARSGRTILFVSHNMTAVNTLCSRVLWLQDGTVKQEGPPDEIIRGYLSTYSRYTHRRDWPDDGDVPGTAAVKLTSVHLEREQGEGPVTISDAFRIHIGFRNMAITDGDLNVSVHVYNGEDVLAFTSSWREGGCAEAPLPLGGLSVWCRIPGDLLNTGEYRIVVNFFRSAKLLFQVEETIAFEVHDIARKGAWFGRRKGVFRPLLQWGVNP
jgi:lipopolysaccharide transport system ATP-binding protein